MLTIYKRDIDLRRVGIDVKMSRNALLSVAVAHGRV